jgi:hypothetical protein
MMAPTDHPSASGHLFAQAYLIHHLLKPALAALLTLLLFGCKLVVTVPEGGRVVTEDGFVCVGPAECVIEVTTDDFDSVFTAEPARGYTFTQWAKKKSSFCGHKTTPCPLSTKGFSAKQILMDVLASDREFYLEPIFVQYDVAYWRRVLAEIDQGSFSTASYLYGATPDVGNCGPGSLNPAPKAPGPQGPRRGSTRSNPVPARIAAGGLRRFLRYADAGNQPGAARQQLRQSLPRGR